MLRRSARHRFELAFCVLAPFSVAASLPLAHLSSLRAQAPAAARPRASMVGEQRALPGQKRAGLRIDYPEDGSIFPPEITAPTFIWHDAGASVRWRILITFGDGAPAFRVTAQGEPPAIGEIDSRCVSSTNQVPVLTPEQAAAHTWKPDAAAWISIKHHSSGRAAVLSLTGLDAAGRVLTESRIAMTTSMDPVGAPIFYRDVPLMPAAGKKGIVQPLSPSLLYLINWRVRDLAQPESRVVMHDLHTCGNCHSFSNDGKTMGMDVDGPGNDKGLYAIVPVQRQMAIRTQDILSWNAERRVGKARVGFMSQLSPDGRYVLSTFAGQDQSIPSSYFVTNFEDYKFLQVFYPTRGILAFYDRTTGRRQPLPGADDPRYVQTDGVWSPDGKYIVFARAEAKDSDPAGQTLPLHANDPHEIQIQYSLFRVPFNDGRGGVPEPIAGASNNGMSNSFPKVSPDGRWIVFVKARNGQLMRPDSELYMVPFAGGTARHMRCNTSLMNSWHSFSPNGRWLVFSSKSRSPYTQMFLTHIDAQGNDSPPIYVDNATAANRAVNIPEFVNIAPDGLRQIDVPAADFYRLVDQAMDVQGKGDLEAALARWLEALALDPQDARANNGAGIVLGQLGRLDQAVPYFQQAVRIDRNFFEAWYDLGIVLARRNRMEEAIAAWENTVRIRPQFAQGHENLGYAFYLLEKYPDALTQLRSAMDEEPGRLIALTLAARILATAPDVGLRSGAEALSLADRANHVAAGKSPAVLDTLSAALAENGNFARAIEVEQEALGIADTDRNGALANQLKAHLERYRANQPLRLPQDAITF